MTGELTCALAGISVIAVWYAVGWILLGRDPSPGVIVPTFEPPAGLSAAAVRYLRLQRYDAFCAIASLVQIAVKGHARIAFDGMALRVTGTTGQIPLTVDEAVFADSLMSDGAFEFRRPTLGTDLGAGVVRFGLASRDLRQQLRTQLAGVVRERSNSVWVVLGGMLSLGWFPLIGFAHDAANPALGAQGHPGLESGVVLALGVLFLNGVLGGFAGIRNTGSMLVELSLATTLACFWAATAPGASGAWFVATGSIVLLAMHVIAWRLLRRWNEQWRCLADSIEGFRMYLATAEGDEIEFLATLPPDRLPPPPTTQRIEMLIPYAVALDIVPRPGWMWLRRSAEPGGGMPSFEWYEGAADLGDYLTWFAQAVLSTNAATRRLARQGDGWGAG